jgi:RecG-like helicase
MSTTTEDEPAAKKAKTEPTGWEEHTMNVSECLMKGDEGKHFKDMCDAEVSTLQGIGEVSSEVLEKLKIKTVSELARYKFFVIARSIKTLSETETKDGRLKGSVMNIDKAVDKAYESKSLKEIVDAPIAALQGISSEAGELLEKLHVKTVGDLAEFKYCRWAESIVAIAEYEETETAAERKQERLEKKLS